MFDWIPDEIKSAARSTINVVGAAARGTTSVVCTGVELVATGEGKVVEGAGWCASKVVGVFSKRLGKATYEGMKSASKFAQTPVRSVTWAAKQGVNVATNVASRLVGDEEGVVDSSMMMTDVNDEYGKHISEFKDSLFESGRQLSGKAVYDRAKRHYDKAVKLREKWQKRLNTTRKRLNKTIGDELDLINACRGRSRNLFSRFEEVSKCIAQWQIWRYEISDDFKPVEVKIPNMMTRAKLFENVDFENNPISTNLKGYLTLGGLTAAEAEQAEQVVKGMVNALREESKKVLAENNRWRKVLESLHDIRVTYDDFLRFYGKLISELEYASTMLRSLRYGTDAVYFKNEELKVNVYFLPERHLRCLMSCDKMSRIVCEMSKRKYLEVSTEDFALKEADVVAYKKDRDKDFAAIKEQMAA